MEIMNLAKWKKLLRSEDCGQAGKLSEELELPTAESALLRSQQHEDNQGLLKQIQLKISTLFWNSIWCDVFHRLQLTKVAKVNFSCFQVQAL